MFSDPKKNVLEFGFVPGQRVADLGSGSGHYSKVLSTTLGPTGKVVAVDIDREMLRKLKNEAVMEGKDNIQVIDGNIEKKNGTKIRDQYFDGAVLSNILYQLNDINGALEETKRILKPGGRLCVVEWSDLSLISGKKALGNKTAIKEVVARETMEKAGFNFEKIFPAGESHYGLIFRKPLQ